MKADALTPRDLFEGKVQFEIPSFQRPYVWSEEDQWAPLWADIKRVAIAVVDADGDPQELERVGAHFLGAVVLKELSHHAGDVARSAVIDGQQRMTTLQIVLDAARQATVVDGVQGGGTRLPDCGLMATPSATAPRVKGPVSLTGAADHAVIPAPTQSSPFPSEDQVALVLTATSFKAAASTAAVLNWASRLGDHGSFESNLRGGRPPRDEGFRRAARAADLRRARGRRG